MSVAWPRAPLGAIAPVCRRPVKVAPDGIYHEIGIRSFGKGTFHKAPVEGAAIGDKRIFKIAPGDLLFSNVFAWEGAIAVAQPCDADRVGSHRFIACRVDAGLAVPEFLCRYLLTPEGLDQIKQASPGGAGRNRTLGLEKLAKIMVPVPPLAEQQRLVAEMNAVAEELQIAHALRKQAASEVEALLTSSRRVMIGGAPKDDWVPLSRYIESIEGGKSPATDGRPAALDEWGVLKVGSVSFGYFDDGENKALPISFTPIPRLEVRPGDFIMSRANTKELVGACALVRNTRPRLMLSDKTFRFVFREQSRILPEYLDHVMKSPALRYQIENGASGTSPTMKNISKEKVLALLVPSVSLEEQRNVVREMDALQVEANTLRRLQAETTAELNALLPAVLDKVFRGELSY